MAEVIANDAARDAAADMEVLVFALGGEEYGVDILKDGLCDRPDCQSFFKRECGQF